MRDIERMRAESEIFDDLARLASSSGYAHVIAAICFRDNFIPIGEKGVDSADIAKMFSDERLLRTEISTLIGLMVKSPIDLKIPEPYVLQEMLDKTDRLMQELHHAMNAPAVEFFQKAHAEEKPEDILTRGEFLREAIFYGSESAYLFQYRDLSVQKYSADNKWLIGNKGFTIDDARAVVASIIAFQNEKLMGTLSGLRSKPVEQWTILPAFTFSADEITEKSGFSIEVVRGILDAFSLPGHERNFGFQAVSDFNATNAFPLLSIGESQYLCFQGYSIAEALYESPFYWMIEDKKYSAIATSNRGKFTEEYCAQRLIDVFGRHRVFKNVTVYRGKNIVAEIDVLVVFGDRVIIVQSKSKRLTIEARKGNDNQLRDDFKRSIQAAYEQGLSCARLLLEGDIRLVADNGNPIVLRCVPAEVYIFCVLSEHYPALAFQARQFLKIDTTEVIKPPFVMDIFTLDAMAEMLNAPLHFLSYVNRRVGYTDRIMSSHELTILSYHLKQNLWVDQKYDLFQLGDDISSDLDAAMLARRDGLPGKKTPDGILTRFAGSSFDRLLKQIEQGEEKASIDLGFMLLTLNEDTVNQLTMGIDAILKQSAADRNHHDVTIGVGNGDTGITVHANFDSGEKAKERLAWHCEKRKYSQRAKTWFGLCLMPESGDIRFGISLDFPWAQSDEMDKVVANLRKGSRKLNLKTYVRPREIKIGRNEPCPCGSGRKHKKCCLGRS